MALAVAGLGLARAVAEGGEADLSDARTRGAAQCEFVTLSKGERMGGVCDRAHQRGLCTNAGGRGAANGEVVCARADLEDDGVDVIGGVEHTTVAADEAAPSWSQIDQRSMDSTHSHTVILPSVMVTLDMPAFETRTCDVEPTGMVALSV